MSWESSDVVRFDIEPLLQGQMKIAKLRSIYNSVIIGPRDFGMWNDVDTHLTLGLLFEVKRG